MAILEMKGIKKCFSGEEILKGIDLSCKEGEVLSIIGPSGSGKSTLLRIATFLNMRTTGQFSMTERRFSKEKHSRSRFRKREIL